MGCLIPGLSPITSHTERGMVGTRATPAFRSLSAARQARFLPLLGRVARVAMLGMLAAIIAASIPKSSEAATRTFDLVAERTPIKIGSGLTYKAWTYNGKVPGPVLKAVQGDEIKIHLTNRTKDAHGIDIHAAQISPAHFSGDPMKPVSYSFKAEIPGVFAYHCSAPPVLVHIASGMYGMMIVAPKGGWPNGPAQDVVIVQSEVYGLPNKNGIIVGDHSKMISAHPDFVIFNGAVNKYDLQHPIKIKVGKLVRVFFVNAGPDLVSAFHVNGALFSTVYRDGNPANAFHNLNTLAVPPSDGAVFEFRVNQPGNYKFVDLNGAHQYMGAAGVFQATR